jgi:hypothetical protein
MSSVISTHATASKGSYRRRLRNRASVVTVLTRLDRAQSDTARRARQTDSCTLFLSLNIRLASPCTMFVVVSASDEPILWLLTLVATVCARVRVYMRSTTMTGDWGKLSLPDIERERERENGGLERERDRLRRGQSWHWRGGYEECPSRWDAASQT